MAVLTTAALAALAPPAVSLPARTAAERRQDEADQLPAFLAAGHKLAHFDPDGTARALVRVPAPGQGPHEAWVTDPAAGSRPPAAGRRLAGPLMAGGVVTLAFSPDSGRVVTAAENGEVRVWDARTGEPLTPVILHATALVHAAFDPAGRRIVTTTEGGVAHVRDAATGRRLAPGPAHRGRPAHAASSPDGRWVATSGGDPHAAAGPPEGGVWDAATGDGVGLMAAAKVVARGA